MTTRRSLDSHADTDEGPGAAHAAVAARDKTGSRARVRADWLADVAGSPA